MKIRQEQMDAMSQSLEDAFVARMVRHLRDDFPNECKKQGMKERDFEPLVRRGIANAQDYGVVFEDDIERYLECMVILGPRFDRDNMYPWARAALRRDNLDGSSKMAQISECMIFQLDQPPTDELLGGET